MVQVVAPVLGMVARPVAAVPVALLVYPQIDGNRSLIKRGLCSVGGVQ